MDATSAETKSPEEGSAQKKPLEMEVFMIIEKAKTGRSTCKNKDCRQVLAMDEVRVGLLAFSAGGPQMRWSHPACIDVEVVVHLKGSAKCKQRKVKIEKGETKTIIQSGSSKFFLSDEGVSQCCLRAILDASAVKYGNVRGVDQLPEEARDAWIAALKRSLALSEVHLPTPSLEKEVKAKAKRALDESTPSAKKKSAKKAKKEEEEEEEEEVEEVKKKSAADQDEEEEEGDDEGEGWGDCG